MHSARSPTIMTLILLPTIFNYRIITSLNIFCDYSMQNFSLLTSNSIYTCTVVDIKQITEPGAEISNIYGDHFNNSKDENVHSVVIDGKIVKFFPKKLETFFAFLSAISIISSNLTTISQKDMTPFTNLRLLDLHNNSIEFLNRDLFVYNPNLEVINLSLNKITNIDPDIFDYLNNLKYLNLENNECISDMENDKNGVKILVTEVKEKCNNCDFELQKNLQSSLENAKKIYNSQIDDLRAEVESLRAQNFEITKRAQILNEDLSSQIDRKNIKMAEMKSSTSRRVFILTVMLIAMCILLIIFTAIIIFLILNIRTWRDKSTTSPEIVEFSSKNEEMIIVKRVHGRKKKLSENLYEDINGGAHIIESAYDKLQYF